MSQEAPPAPSHTARDHSELPAGTWLSFLAATTGTFMVNVDANVVNVALPVLQHEFRLGVATLQWVITAYLLVITGLLPVAGRLADRLGRREVFVVGVAFFVLGSLACALSPGFGVLVAARAFQGLGGATVMANVTAIVALTFPPERRGQALGWIGSVVAAGTLAGPPLGGLLTAIFGWRSIFWINVPVGVAGIVGSLLFLPRFPRLRGRDAPFDHRGAALFAATTTLLQFSLAELHERQGLLLLAATAVSAWLFYRVESVAEEPLVPVRLLRIPSFSLNLLSGMGYWILMMFPAFLLPFYLRLEEGLPEGLIGLSLIPQALAMIVVSPLGGRWLDRSGVLPPARTGLLLLTGADAALAFASGHAPLWLILSLLAVIGAAAGLFSSPNNAAVLASVAKDDTGIASSLLATQRNLGRSVGIGLASILLTATWIALGVGPSPSHAAPAYPHWFLLAFRGVFLTSPLFGALALAAFRAPPKNAAPAR